MATKFDAAAIARQIVDNVQALDAREITFKEFGQRNRAAWDRATRGEPCVIGSAASNRVAAVHIALKREGAAA